MALTELVWGEPPSGIWVYQGFRKAKSTNIFQSTPVDFYQSGTRDDTLPKVNCRQCHRWVWNVFQNKHKAEAFPFDHSNITSLKTKIFL